MKTTDGIDAPGLDALIIADVASGRVALWNPTAEILFGYSTEDAIGLPINTLLADTSEPVPATRETLMAAAARVARGQDQRVVVRTRTRRGSAFAATVSISLVDDETDPGRFLLARIRPRQADGVDEGTRSQNEA